MLKSILAASDLSSRSKPAVWRAVQLSQKSEAILRVLHVVEDDQPESIMRESTRSAEEYLQEQISSFGPPKQWEVLIRAGGAFSIICEEADARQVDLIVMGAHRRQFLRDVFIGTTVERVTRTAGRPVLMVNGMTRWKKVFIAADMSETSADAARKAHALGVLDGVEVTFVHAYAPITKEMMIYAHAPEKRVKEEADREFRAIQRDFAHFVQGLGFEDLDYSMQVVEGLGGEPIADVVKQEKADLLVIGTRGLSGVKRLLLGSVAQELMGSLETDILAVPPKV